jgi:far upstream element-binding protein
VATEYLDMPREKVGIVIGTRGTIVQDIMARSGCKVVLNQDVPEGTPCKAIITGYPDQIDVAKSLILSVISHGPSGINMVSSTVASNFVQEIPIDQSHVGKLLGPGGAVIKDLQQRFGVKMKIDNVDGGEAKVFRITGEVGRVRASSHAVMEIIHSQDVFIPRGHAGATGHGQQQQPGYYSRNAPAPPAAHGYPQDQIVGSLPNGTLGLGADGSAGNLYPASTMPNGLQSQVAVIRPNQAGKVLGHNMSTLDLIRKKCGADLHTRPDYSPDMHCEITIVGPPPVVRLAGQMIQEALLGGLSKIQDMPDYLPPPPLYPTSTGFPQPPIGYGQYTYGAGGYPPEGSTMRFCTPRLFHTLI